MRSTSASISLPILLSGIALGVSFPPNGIPVLAWAALVPLLLRWDEAVRPRVLLTEVYTAYLLAYALALFWPLLTAYPQTLVLSLGGLLLIPLLLAVPFAVSLPIRQRYGRPSGLVALVAVHLTVEFVLQHGPIPFPWVTFGHTQANMLPLAQMVSWTGVAGLTLWLLLVNTLVFLTIAAAASRTRQIGYGLLTVALVAGSWGAGHWLQQQETEPDGYVTVGLIQPGMSTEYEGASDEERLARLVQLSDSLVQSMGMPPTLIVWPGLVDEHRTSASWQSRYLRAMQRWTDQMQAALLMGTELIAADRRRTNAKVRHNSAVLFRPNQRRHRYDQVDLVPFAEHVPGSQHVPLLRRIVQPAAEARPLVPGQRHGPLTYDGINIGVLVGFEAILSDPTRALARKQADFLVAMTHDAWWGRAPGYRQHLAHVRLRAIASRKTVVQVTRSGSTAVISPDGTMIHADEPMAALSRMVTVPLHRAQTLYVRVGDWISLIALAITAVLGAWWVIVRRMTVPGHPPPKRAPASANA
ncbi:MAG: apolipoprotein N-acyltransferase [Bacteroidetes bacterium]|nr:apolipoprotein N-acyltransferase [Bacteroidota bacterium]